MDCDIQHNITRSSIHWYAAMAYEYTTAIEYKYSRLDIQ